jgi:hypothetical protein
MQNVLPHVGACKHKLKSSGGVSPLVLPFLDFSTIPYEFSKLAEMEMEKGTDSSQKGPWKDLKQSNQVPGRFFLSGTDRRRAIPAR